MKTNLIRIGVLLISSTAEMFAQSVSFDPSAWIERPTSSSSTLAQFVGDNEVDIYAITDGATSLNPMLSTSLTGSGLDFHFTSSSSEDTCLYLSFAAGTHVSFTLTNVTPGSGITVTDFAGGNDIFGKTTTSNWVSRTGPMLTLTDVGLDTSYSITGNDANLDTIQIRVAANSGGFTLSNLAIGDAALIPEPSSYAVMLAGMSITFVGFRWNKARNNKF